MLLVSTQVAQFAHFKRGSVEKQAADAAAAAAAAAAQAADAQAAQEAADKKAAQEAAAMEARYVPTKKRLSKAERNRLRKARAKAAEGKGKESPCLLRNPVPDVIPAVFMVGRLRQFLREFGALFGGEREKFKYGVAIFLTQLP